MFDIHENLPICHDLDSGKHRTTDVLLEEKVTFSSLLLKEEIQSGLTRCGYTYLSPIQKNALPVALTGTSIIAHAKSGTGKTLVYVLTVLNSILERKQSNIQCLILSPTREIAKQIYDVFKNVGYYIKDLKVEYFIGGTPLDIDVLKCKECRIAVGAPGRIKHLIKLGEMKTESIQMLVLDEVDALLCNKEFAIPELASYLPPEKQTIVCTATFSDNIKHLLTPISSTIQYITVSERKENEENDPVTSNILIGIKQYIAPVFCDSTSLDTIRKRNKLIEILRNFKHDQCFIFVNYVTIAKGLCNMLISNDFPALWVSSEQNQSTRISTLNKLKLNQCDILVTTDLAARGIDVHNVNLVINMGIPSPPDVYIHRMGRAGRYGSEGAVITILHEGQEMDQFPKLISSVSTDPVVLYILPNEINKDVHNQPLETIKCIPDLNAPTNMNEYHFKKNNENQGQKTTKKKSKKSKKKRKSKKDPSIPKNDSLDQEKEDFSSEEESPADVVVDKEMEKLVELYIATIKEEIHRDRVTIDENTLRSFFKPNESILSPVPFTDYFKTTFVPIRKENDDDDDVFVQPNDDETLIQYARFVKKKHAFLDEQKIPCSILQFLELIKQNESLIDDHVSANVRDSVKEVLGKIRNLLTKDRRKPSVTSKKSKPVNFQLEAIEKNPLKRINDRVSDEPQSLDTVNSIEQETSNWMISRVEHLAAKYSPKRSKNQHISLPVKNFTADPPNITNDASFTVFQSTRVHSDGEDDNIITYPSRINPLPNVPVRGHSLNRPPVSHSNGITCPNCQHTFTLSGMNMVPPLQPISSYVNADMERRIWQNHFNFINNRVRSLPFIFGNR